MADALKPIKVFLCSTFVDLLAERKSVLEAIKRLQLQHDSMEVFGARSKLPIKTCLEEVRSSDVLVVIVGHRYGNLVPRRHVSFSQAEYREAYRQRKPCLVYMRDDDVEVKPGNVESDPRKIRLFHKWKQTLAKRHTVCKFRDSTDLAIQVAVDLSRMLRALEAESLNSRRQEPEVRRLELEHKAYVTNLEKLVSARTEQLRQAMADLERAYDITLEALGDAMDLKSAEPEGHCKRVTALTFAIGRAMGLSGEKLRVIARGAYLHDIGNMSIPNHILRKQGELTPEEMQTMREHCFRGYMTLNRIPFLTGAAEIVYAHQEHYDGTGYPRGLRGAEIPLGARIFSVADALDSITSGGPHRAALSIEVAREEIQRGSGTQFDPDVVRVLLGFPASFLQDLRDEIARQSVT